MSQRPKKDTTPVPVVDGSGTYYPSINAAARANETTTNCIRCVLNGQQKTTGNKTFRRATVAEIAARCALSAYTGVKKIVAPAPSGSGKTMVYDSTNAAERSAKVVSDSKPDATKDLIRALEEGGYGASSTAYASRGAVGKILRDPVKMLGPGVSESDVALLRLQLGEFDVLWDQYRDSMIFKPDQTVTEDDIQFGKLLDVAQRHLRRRYDAARTRRQGS